MLKLTVGELAEASGGELVKGAEDCVICGVSTDSRKIEKGMLFVPIIAQRDGHDFIGVAVEKGASAVFTSEDVPEGDTAVIRVGDTLRAMGDAAAFYKAKYRIPTVAVTGSVGKTTTKDMLYAALSAKYKTVKTQNNYNNDIGVPLTVFSQEKEHEAAVIEMGMNHFGEIERLAEIVKPDVAVITNIGMSHIENLGDQEGILRAKTEITTGFGRDNTLIINGDDRLLATITDDKPYKIVRYGAENPKFDAWAENVVSKGLDGVEFDAVTKEERCHVFVNRPGIHNVYNALAAICTGIAFGVRIEDAVRGIENCEYTSQRLEVIRHKDTEIINDCYNASPDSMRAAISVMCCSLKDKKAAVLGDMLEMGDYAPEAHYEIGKFAAESGINMLITAGESSKQTAQGARDAGMKEVYAFDTTEAAAEFAAKNTGGCCVLVKASHGMHFEKIVETIKET